MADKRVKKLKGSRLKWSLGAIAGVAAGIYLEWAMRGNCGVSSPLLCGQDYGKRKAT